MTDMYTTKATIMPSEFAEVTEANEGGVEKGGDPEQDFPVTGPQRPGLLAKLTEVNSKNEPLSGTPPERWLFDRSNSCSVLIPLKDIGI